MSSLVQQGFRIIGQNNCVKGKLALSLISASVSFGCVCVLENAMLCNDANFVATDFGKPTKAKQVIVLILKS